MTALLDTHTILYLAIDPDKLGYQARQIVETEENNLIASINSLWEIAIKLRIGKLLLPLGLDDFWSETIEKARLSEIGVSKTTILRTLELDLSHRDPFDRFLAAQALELNIPFLSADSAVDPWGVQRIWH